MRTQLSTALVLSLLLLAGCTDTGSPDQAATSGPARSACGSPVETGPLPEWARAGFSGDASMPHVLGDRGTIVGALFGHPLAVTRPDGTNNKILWVPKAPAPTGDLVIDAKLDNSTLSAHRRVAGGPGPSILDLPQAGCWHLTLTWPDHTDTLDLIYR